LTVTIRSELTQYWGMGPTHRCRNEDGVISVTDAARELVERSTAAQHLPVRVEDPAVLAVVAVLLGSVAAARSTSTSRPLPSSGMAPTQGSDLGEPTTSAA